MKFSLLVLLLGMFMMQSALADVTKDPNGTLGCDWRATVTQIGQHNGVPTVVLKLDTQKGSCAEVTGYCGAERQLVYAPMQDDADDYSVGEKFDVWVTDKTASLTIPPCADDITGGQ